MKFLYPEFNEVTHTVSGSMGITIEYPSSDSYATISNYPKVFGDEEYPLDGLSVAVIRENVGYDSKWSYVKVIDNNLYDYLPYREFYALKENLINVSSKQTYLPINTEFNKIDPSALEINPISKEIFVPYIDRRNGFYSIRIQVDYERIIDMMLFKKVLQEVYLEGVGVLLASRGFASDNQAITDLKNKYYTFAYVQNDLDLTTRRMCEPITFTVSIPLNFFNAEGVALQPKVLKQPISVVSFTNYNFISTIEKLMTVISSRDIDLQNALMPNKILENFITDFELNSIRNFAVATNELMSIAGYEIKETGPNIIYEIGLDQYLNIVSMEAKRETDSGYQRLRFNEGFLSLARLKGEFNNKRIFYYLLNLLEMSNEISGANIIEFLEKYVKFPNVRLVDEKLNIKGIDIEPEKLKQFRMSFNAAEQNCATISDIKNGIGALADSLNTFSDPVYNIFALFDPKNSVSVYSIGDKLRENVNSLNDYYKIAYSDPANSKGNVLLYYGSSIGNFASSTGAVIGSSVVSTGGMAEQVGQNFARDYLSDINSLFYVFKRLDLQELTFKAIFCALKGLNPNNPEVNEILAKIPGTIINYFTYIDNLRNLRGYELLKYIESGINFDMKLFCGDETVYFLKGLITMFKTISAFSSASITYIREIDAAVTDFSKSLGVSDQYRAKNPYGAIAKAIADIIYKSTMDFVFDWLKDILTVRCDDALFNDYSDSFADPFNTHIPFTDFNNVVNNNKDILKRNRLNTLEQALPEIVRNIQFGSDINYTVDIIGLLINDIRCILTVNESTSLLKGTPPEEVVILIKNIIRNKYSKDPNNLTYLLNDDILKLFFRKLGATVDQKILNPTEVSVPFITNGDVCTPAQYNVRKKILEGKLPPELAVLEDDNKNRIEKVRNLIDKINKGETVLNISGLCSDIQDENILNTKGNIVKQYINSIKSMFSDVMSSFTQEASSLSTKFSEEKHLIRQDNGTIIDDYTYYNYNSNLSKNLQHLQTSNNQPNYWISYQDRGEFPIPYWQIQDIYLNTKREAVRIEEESCVKENDDLEFQIDDRFVKFLEEGRVIWENRPWDRKWDNINKTWGDRGGQRVWESQFSQELRKQQPELYEYIKQKEYVLIISSELGLNRQFTAQEYNDYENFAGINTQSTAIKRKYRDLIEGEKIEKISFRLIRYDAMPGNDDKHGDFRTLYESEFEPLDDSKDSEEEKNRKLDLRKSFRIDIGNYTGEIISNLQLDRRDNQVIQGDLNQFYLKTYPYIAKFFRIEEVDDNRRYGSHVLSKDIINISKLKPVQNGEEYTIIDNIPIPSGYSNPKQTLNILQKYFINSISPAIEQINFFNALIRSSNAYKKYGLFHILFDYNQKEKILSKKVMVSTSDPLKDDLIYSTFYTNKLSINKFLKNDEILYVHLSLANLIYKQLQDNSIILEEDSYRTEKSASYDYKHVYFKEIEASTAKGKWRLKPEINTVDSNGKIKEFDITNILQFQSKEDAYQSTLNNRDYKIVPNPEYQDYHKENYSNMIKLDMQTDLRYKNCNLTPHYLNLDYFLNKLSQDSKQKLCDNNLDKVPVDLLKEVLINITFRAYITDLMVKLIPLLSLYDRDDLSKIHKEQGIIDILREHLKKEMQIFTNSLQADSQNTYYISFKNMLDEYFNSSENSNKINFNTGFKSENNENQFVDYFISKEIKHFLAFSIDKKVFSPSNISYYKKYLEDPQQFIKGFNYNFDYSVLTPDLIKSETYTFIIYFLMSSTIDYVKRSVFINTKEELFKIFRGLVNISSNQAVYEERTPEDITKVIRNIAYSHNPSAMIYINTGYSKYINFAIDAVRRQSKSILLTNALQTDPNIAITYAINRIASATSTMAWGLTDQNVRNNLILEASVKNKSLAYLYNRFNNGMSPVPNIVVAGGLSIFGVFPGVYGIPYLALDTLDEYDWYVKATKEIEELAKHTAQDKDPCEIVDINTDITCETNSQKLVEELNKFEN